MKKCTKCGIEKDLSAFYAHPKTADKKSSSCKECDDKKKKKWIKENPEKVKNSKYANTYGITLDQYNKMYTNQNGCCAICGVHQDAFSRALSVDHCHSTKVVRGLLCTNCNTALGSFKDNVSSLLKAVEYLTNPPYKDKD